MKKQILIPSGQIELFEKMLSVILRWCQYNMPGEDVRQKIM